MAERVRTFDWSRTPLGPMEQWPQSLRTAVSICLNSRFPMFVWWGRELINIYNDAYAPILGKRHPAALGEPAQAIWSEIWPTVGPQADAVMSRGEATWNERVLLVMERKGFTEETWFTWSYSPITDESGGVGGLFCACVEETASVRAEAGLVEMAERLAGQSRLFEQIASTTPDFIYIFDLDGRFRYANRRLLEVWGRTYDDAVGKSPIELGYPQWHADMHMRELRQVIETRQPIKGEVPFTGGSGISGVYEYIFTPVLGPDGQVQVVAGTTRDVTDRHQLLRALESERANLAAIIEQAPAFIATLRGPQHVFELANERYYEIVGRRDIIGRPLREALPEVVGQGFPELLDRVYRTGETFTANELRVLLQRQADGPLEQRFMSFTYLPLRDPEGGVSGIFVHGVDVTDLVTAREAQRESEQRLRLTADAIPALIAYVDTSMRYRFANAAYFQWFGVEPEHVVGRPVREVVGEASYAERSAFINRALNGETSTFEYPMTHLTRGPRDTETTYVPDVGEDGVVRGFVVLVYDITARKEAERERERLLDRERAARSEAERASRMKDEFLATLSHELRTPLNAILGWSQILAGNARRTEADLDEGLEVIERNARAQTQIIEDLLEMSRIISGKVRLDVRRMDLADTVRAAVDTVRPAAAARGVALEVRVGASPGPAAAPMTGDPNRLQQVFWNLLSNAVKFTPRGGSVTVTLLPADTHLSVSVTDTGEGIRPDFLPHVFDRFRQADASTTRRHGGLGLGLAIVKQLVELHGGTVRAATAGAGRGSTFTVSLPLAHAGASAEPRSVAHPGAPNAAASVDGEPNISGLRVLVVDDEQDARNMVRRLLEDYGVTVHTAASAGEAFDSLSTQSFNVVVSDIGMPGEDGYSLIRRVRALPPHRGGDIPAIALTAYARTEDRLRAIREGFHHHVVKPVDPAELIAIIAAVARRA